MEICEITLDAKQYDLLKSMLNCDRRADLIRKIPINGKELFYDMIHEIYSPVTDGWKYARNCVERVCRCVKFC